MDFLGMINGRIMPLQSWYSDFPIEGLAARLLGRFVDVFTGRLSDGLGDTDKDIFPLGGRLPVLKGRIPFPRREL